ncbi:hypothetical protein [Micromonospora fulviviridis]|uniref:Uncharacterized protein n=1 Tax=Micromonospora fulviviridis TaxID=47860 RepID=A0ABV2VTS6_9ACTN
MLHTDDVDRLGLLVRVASRGQPGGGRLVDMLHFSLWGRLCR